MATNQIIVNVYQMDKQGAYLPQPFTFPATGFATQPAINTANGNTFTTVTVSGTGVDCYSIISRSGHEYLVKETPATLQALANA